MESVEHTLTDLNTIKAETEKNKNVDAYVKYLLEALGNSNEYSDETNESKLTK